MCKKLISLASLIMVFGLVANVAVVSADTNWTGMGADDLWSTALTGAMVFPMRLMW